MSKRHIIMYFLIGFLSAYLGYTFYITKINPNTSNLEEYYYCESDDELVGVKEQDSIPYIIINNSIFRNVNDYYLQLGTTRNDSYHLNQNLDFYERSDNDIAINLYDLYEDMPPDTLYITIYDVNKEFSASYTIDISNYKFNTK